MNRSQSSGTFSWNVFVFKYLCGSTKWQQRLFWSLMVNLAAVNLSLESSAPPSQSHTCTFFSFCPSKMIFTRQQTHLTLLHLRSSTSVAAARGWPPQGRFRGNADDPPPCEINFAERTFELISRMDGSCRTATFNSYEATQREISFN